MSSIETVSLVTDLKRKHAHDDSLYD